MYDMQVKTAYTNDVILNDSVFYPLTPFNQTKTGKGF